MSLNRDAFVAVFFLLLCAVMFVASFDLPPPMFGQMSPALWPRIILVPLALLSVLLLFQSQRNPADNEKTSFSDWIEFNKRPFVCFVLFFLFLVTMPVAGMLLGGLAYVFLTLSVLGGWKPRQLGLHAVISAVFVIGMWAVFTQALGVLLPEGEILRVY
ncbi:MAG: tripartite tricarboxylate transporter TctB family protein [Roseibium sp.]|uniref:tripartite tricarboxylate transporter TctB family protein n=1 Tax=Roseibium sp. TaxID=1936156 RepID=UPI001B008BBD|nr:tripartite tricarboxylate transporter TctB family protein [Roseibium sp.]MBO6894820.1 tripartite tricarboxylate transporter TctB family protein [Roseibium sp.]MBO6930393.1 tripartite tricarboxylate transporter TctB family protein [Roseibium sp.]